MKIFLFWTAFFMSVHSSAWAREKSRPMSEMHGNCTAFKTDLARELILWREKATKVTDADLLPLEKKVSLPLTLHSRVAYLVQPEKKVSGKKKKYGGVFLFRVAKAGKYKVSAGAKLWFDVVDKTTGQWVDADEFEMQTGCDQILKVVTFTLKDQGLYALQVSGSASHGADFLVTPNK